MLMILMVAGSVMAGTLTSGTTAPTGVFASGGVDAPNYTRIFADGARPTDDNEGRGNFITADSGSYADYLMDALVIRKDVAQDFTGTTASLTLYVFEGTEAMWDAGDGQGDDDLFDETGITVIYEETFALNGSYAEGDYITLTLDTPITMAPEMGFFIQMTQGTSSETYFQIGQYNFNSGGDPDADGNQYQSKTTENLITGSPLEYYAVGVNPSVATNVFPTGDAVDPVTATAITWDPPLGYTPEVGYDLIVRTATEDNEPNFAAGGDIIDVTNITSPQTVALAYGSTYWCSLTAYEPNGIANNASDDTPHSIVWSFTTAVYDKVPAVTLTPRYVTWPEEFPDDIVAEVDDNGEGDIASVAWEFVYGPGVAAAGDMKMMDRVSQLDNIASDPNLFRDWIGTDRLNGGHTSDVLNLTLSGLPSGTYAWKSYHYDAWPYTSPGVFDVTVTDSTGSTTTTGVAQAAGTSEPAVFTTTFSSDGSDVTLQFVGFNDGDGSGGQFFAMNAFELTGSGDPLWIDFTKKQESPDPNFVQPGYQAYLGISNLPESFTAQSFSAFGVTVTVTPDWDAPGMEITGVSGTTPTLTATVALTDAPKIFGQYQIRATATDTAEQEGSGTTLIQVEEDACAAAKYLGVGLNVYDADENCIVDLADFAAFAAEWLDDISLSGPTNW